jgi:hypothetical protein
MPETPKNPSAGRYVRLEIRVPVDDYERGLPFFGDRKRLNQYVVEALQERINRAEANDKTSRLRKLMTDMNLLLPALKELWNEGKLGFLNEREFGEGGSV